MNFTSRLLVVLVALLWGFNFVVIRWGIEDIDPATMTALRFFFTAFPLIFFVKRPNVKLGVLALYGILFGAGVWGLVNLSVALGTPAGHASLLLQLSAFLTVIAGLLKYAEPFTLVKKVGIGIAFLGFATVVFNKGNAVSSFGVALVFLSAGFWTICNMIIKSYKPDNVVGFIVWSSLFVPIPFGAVMLLSQSGEGTTTYIGYISGFSLPTMKGWASIFFQAFATTLLGYGIWSYSISRYGLSNVAPYSLLVPISGLFFGWLLYQEVLSSGEIVGSALVIIGLALLSVNNLKYFTRGKYRDIKSQ
ncbi:EamA family transporter [Halomonas faecis]|uniref:EamA family transporter n=1 Tax=Halomonas faecis TaxID=1562110 RepID=UPI0013D8CE46|nr:EamA family transporter [Halomonas faecis]